MDKLVTLLVCNESRGDQSTGLFSENDMAKKAVPASRAAGMKIFRDVMRNDNAVGHTRFATTGYVSDKNAHPFTFGSITGVHNGVISNFPILKHRYDLAALDVDSEIVFWGLDKFGIEFLRQVEGSMALVWYDRALGKWRAFVRNGTLHHGRIGDQLFISSEAHPLRAIGVKRPRAFKPHNVYDIVAPRLEIVTRVEPRVELFSQTPAWGFSKAGLSLKSWQKTTPFQWSMKSETLVTPAVAPAPADGADSEWGFNE